jgi:hypothetical protein
MIEQIAFKAPDIGSQINSFARLGIKKESWIRDTVTAVNLYTSWYAGDGISAFEVELAFSYEILADSHLEFELIQLIKGKTCQFLLDKSPPSFDPELAHVGFHVEDYDKEPESLSTELKRWRRKDAKVLQVAQTILHTGTSKRYRYAFVDACPYFGVPLKIIQRYKTGELGLPLEDYLFGETAKEFEWLEK